MMAPGAHPVPATPGLLLLHEPHARPTREQVRAALEGHGCACISHDPAAGGKGSEEAQPPATAWLELLVDGLTFDCLGLAPGPAIDVPVLAQRFGVAADCDPLAFEAIGLFAGPHLAGGANTLPVFRTQMSLAADLIEYGPAPRLVGWGPSRAAMAPGFFLRAIKDWLSGGAFPALGFVSYRFDSAGRLCSEGLAFFTGQELRVEAPLARDPVAATRLSARLVHELVACEPLGDRAERATAEGTGLQLVPTEGGRVIEVTAL